MSQAVERAAPTDIPGAASTPAPPDVLHAVLEGMDTAVVAVHVGSPRLLANAAARVLFALPERRVPVVDDLVHGVRILPVRGYGRLGVDDLPLVRALAGREVEAEVVVLGSEVPAVAVPAADVSVEGRRLLLRARPLFGDQAEVVGAVCTAQDLTDLHTQHALLTRRAAELAAINRATRAVLKDEDARRAVCETATRVSRATLASLYEPDGRDALVCTTHLGADLLGLRVPVTGPSIVAEVFACGVPRVVQGASTHLAVEQEALDRVCGPARFPLGAGVWLPVVSRGRCIAVLSLAFGAGTPVREHLQVLEILAGETAVAIERQDLLRRLQAEATSDSLTGAANRRVWEEELPRTLAEAARSGTPVSMVMLDLDHFKRYNDTHGHPAGDNLLRAAVSAWKLRLSPGDLLCRYGGEEFVVLLPGRDVGQARAVAEQLRGVVPERQTCSAGVAGWDGRESAEDLVARVDTALYGAKLSGRNQVCAAA